MATIHHATLTPTKLDLVAAWIGSQRWYAGKGHTPALSRLRGYRLDDPAGEVGIETVVVRDDATTPAAVYQIPLTYRAAPLAGAEQALVGTMEHSVLGTRYVYDAPHDPVYAAQLWRFLQGWVDAQSSTDSDTAEWAFNGHGVGDPARWVAASRVLTGEQSNTSIICDLQTGSGQSAGSVIVKVFRALSPGPNPDIVLQSALAAAGCRHIAGVAGWVAGTWLAEGPEGHLAFAQEFVPDTRDAWRVALEAVAEGRDLTDRMRELGAATAQIHGLLAAALPTEEPTAAHRDRLAASLHQRLDAAIAQVPGLADSRSAIEGIYDVAVAGPWPTLHRIHGDLHLGQVIDAPGRGWVFLDFEGEPLRPLAERGQPDLAARDVAGMLRSFDYAAGTQSLSRPETATAAQHWAAQCRAAYLAGYGEGGGSEALDASLLAALELDKAVYEVLYEARNRPTWLPIPRAAVDRLTRMPRS